jgi:SAM-dependent methyltransferase
MTNMKLYNELAHWWPLLSPPKHYVEEADFFIKVLQATETLPRRTMLELGSGGGSNAYHLKQYFAMTLVDPAQPMLDVSQIVNPECEHLVGDMRTLRLDRQFDCVFIHDAIDYMTTEADLKAAFITAYLHCKPGGTVLLVPDHTRETFEETSAHEGEDSATDDGRALRMMEWTFDPDVNDSTSVTHYVFMLREGDKITVEHDQHTFGLFSRETWLSLLREVGLMPEHLVDEYERDVFVATKPGT